LNKILTLIVDDHPIITEAFENSLKSVESETDFIFEITTTNSLSDALRAVNAWKDKTQAIIVFIDIQMPPEVDVKLFSGEDLGIEVRKILPDAKIIICTAQSNNYRLSSIIKNIDPEGFLVKSDLNAHLLKTSIQRVIANPPVYSARILKLLRKQMVNDFNLDKIDRQILFELSLGTNTKDLPKIIHLSLTAVERRKRLLKETFNVKDSKDSTLIKEARNKGFI
jgi:DNA-binding NarL/FixJ family response regulator